MALHEFLFTRNPPQPRPGPRTGPPTAGERMVFLLENEIDERVGAMHTAGPVALLKDDLEDAFGFKGEYAPGYEVGAEAPLAFSLLHPVSSVKRIAFGTDDLSKYWDHVLEKMGPDFGTIWDEVQLDIWERALATTISASTAGVSYGSLRHAFLAWQGSAGYVVTRRLREDLLKSNPGLTLMMADRLNEYYTAALPTPMMGIPIHRVAGVSVQDILREADEFENGAYLYDAAGRPVLDASGAHQRGPGMAALLDQAEAAEKAGRRGEAERLRRQAEALQVRWQKRSEGYRDAVREEFEKIAKRGRRRGATRAERDLANSAEAKLWDYWRKRSLYYQTFNFLSIYSKGGLTGIAQYYAWNKAIASIFGKSSKFASAGLLGKLRYLAYPPHLLTWLREKSIDKIIGNLTKGVLTRLAKLRKRLARFGAKVIGKAITKLISKLGLKVVLSKIGALIGSVVPGAGTAVGAVAGAVASFVVQKLFAAIGGKLKPVLGVTFKGIALALAGVVLLFGAGVFIIIGAVVLIFNPNAVLPAEDINLPITMTKEACEPAPSCSNFENPLQIKKDGKTHNIRWRITVRNGGSEDVVVSFSDEKCGLSVTGLNLKKGKEKKYHCQQSVAATGDEVITNTAQGETIPDSDSFTGVGVVVVGTPAMDFPHTWPLASGCITQGPGGSYSHVGVEAIDIDSNNEGNPVFATHNGTVIKACYTDPVFGCTGSAGNNVQVQGASGYVTWYAHLATVNVKVGDTVVYGQPIGTVGNTGNSTAPHLHYEFKGLDMAPPYIPREVPACTTRAGCSSMMGGNSCW